METNEEKLIRLQKLEDCIRSLYMEIPCEANPEFIEYIKQFVKLWNQKTFSIQQVLLASLT